MRKRKLRISFYNYDPDRLMGLSIEHAHIETADGWYVCEVHRCDDEGRKRFRLRARSIMFALERYPGPILTTSPNE